MHIKWLELFAVLFGVKCFVCSHNCLAVAYMNNLGGECFLASMQFLIYLGMVFCTSLYVRGISHSR